MKSLLKGFTLAEVLITIAVIGIVASMTLPNLSVNVQKQQVGPALAKAINTLENANLMALNENNVRDLEDIGAADYSEIIEPYVQSKSEASTKSYYKYNGTTSKTFPAAIHTFRATKDGITFIIGPASVAATAAARPRSGAKAVYSVYVDVNGRAKGPNAYGKDVFRLAVDSRGNVMPYGGKAFNDNISAAQKWTGGGCSDPKKAPTNEDTCAGSVVDNGFKVIYKY